MKLTFLGSGSAFVRASENFQSNILLEFNGKSLLIDAGSTINEALFAANKSIDDIDAIYITHLHGDHVHGLEYLGFSSFFSGKKLTLIGEISIIFNLWDNILSGTMGYINGKKMTIHDYFNIVTHGENKPFKFNEVDFFPKRVYHVVGPDGHAVPANSIYFSSEKNNIFISGDSQFQPKRLEPFYKEADVIFNEVEFAEYSNSVHTQFKELSYLDDSIKEKMYLYHYSLNGKPFNEVNEIVTNTGFAGLVKRGQIFDI